MKIVDERIDHVHLHTRELEPPVRLLTALFGSQFCGAYDVPSAGTCTAYNPASGLEVSVPLKPREPGDAGPAGRIFRVCFVVEDLEAARKHFAARGVGLLNEIDLPGIAHELQFDPRDCFGIAIQLGVWGPGLGAIQARGLEQGARQYPAPAALPIGLVGEEVERVHCAVQDLDAARRFFSDLLQVPFRAPFEVPEWKLRACASPVGVVLMEPSSAGSALAAEIAEKGPQHICRVGFTVRDLDHAVAHFASQGQAVERRLTREGLRVAHFRPGDAFGVGISLRELGPGGEALAEAAL